jgi:hypothetical protein
MPERFSQKTVILFYYAKRLRSRPPPLNHQSREIDNGSETPLLRLEGEVLKGLIA